jgi:hypothetical protein
VVGTSDIGPTEVGVAAPGYASEFLDLALPETGEVYANFTLALLPLAELDTIVLDHSTQGPISNATVTMRGIGVRSSDPSGWANFSRVPEGNYLVSASAPGYDVNQTTAVLQSGQVILRYPINLTRTIPKGSTPPSQSDFALLPPDAQTIWPLLLLPLAALVLGVVYLSLLRVPAATPKDAEERTEEPPQGGGPSFPDSPGGGRSPPPGMRT